VPIGNNLFLFIVGIPWSKTNETKKETNNIELKENPSSIQFLLGPMLFKNCPKFTKFSILIDCLTLASLSRLVLCLRVGPGTCPRVEHLKGASNG
jgi:hypothetical protein